MKSVSAVVDKILLRESITLIKRKGDNGSPCLRPLDALVLPLGLPLIIIEKLVEEMQPQIHCLHFVPIPLIFNNSSR